LNTPRNIVPRDFCIPTNKGAFVLITTSIVLKSIKYKVNEF